MLKMFEDSPHIQLFHIVRLWCNTKDLSGTNEGVVKLWHWGSNDALSSYKQVEKSASAKITKLLFNNHGNKVTKKFQFKKSYFKILTLN